MKFAGYKDYRNDRDRHGGGTTIFVKKTSVNKHQRVANIKSHRNNHQIQENIIGQSKFRVLS